MMVLHARSAPRAILPALLLSLLFVGIDARSGHSQSPQGAPPAPVCVYRDRTFSEGAVICPHARLMLMCSNETERLIWKVVGDQSLAERCSPRAIAANAGHRRPVRRQRIAAPAAAPTDKSPKCFDFNNKRYCE